MGQGLTETTDVLESLHPNPSSEEEGLSAGSPLNYCVFLPPP